MNTTTTHQITILFEEPFWIGLIEKIENDQLQVCKFTFGAEPSDHEVLEYISRNWNKLKYSPSLEIETKVSSKNPKRLIRDARRQATQTGIGTKSQQALKLLHECTKLQQKHKAKEEKKAEIERRFELRQIKRKKKHRGH